MTTSLFVADAFVGTLGERQLLGNPAAVVLLEQPRKDAWMQRVAAEMNLSETAFVAPRDAQNFDLRWFTPATEVKLCGHATLAAAHVLWDQNWLQPHQTAHFDTLSGILTARQRGEWIELDFPAQAVEPCELPLQLREALHLENAQVGSYRADDDWLLEIPLTQIETLQPDFALLREVSLALEVRGVIVTAASEGAQADFVSRFFAPAVGIDEDPVTGSAHTKLAPFWANRLNHLDKTREMNQRETNQREMTGFQASRRGGLVRVQVQGERVVLGGQVEMMLRGQLCF